MSLFGPIVTCRCAKQWIKIFNLLIHTCSLSSTRTTRARIPSQLMSKLQYMQCWTEWQHKCQQKLPTILQISDPSFGILACHDRTKQSHKQGEFEGAYRLDNCCKRRAHNTLAQVIPHYEATIVYCQVPPFPQARAQRSPFKLSWLAFMAWRRTWPTWCPVIPIALRSSSHYQHTSYYPNSLHGVNCKHCGFSWALGLAQSQRILVRKVS